MFTEELYTLCYEVHLLTIGGAVGLDLFQFGQLPGASELCLDGVPCRVIAAKCGEERRRKVAA